MGRLFLVRHGETELNSSERYWGRTDVALNADGLRQAERLRERLAGEKIDAIYSSHLKRAMVTAQTIASAHQLEVVICPELREIDFGQLEGLTFNEINQLYPEIVRRWFEGSSQLVYPGGESLAELEERVRRFRSRLDKHSEKESILVVAHNGVLRTLICQLLGWETSKRWQIRLNLGSLTIVETYPEGARLALLNDVSHLAERG